MLNLFCSCWKCNKFYWDINKLREHVLDTNVYQILRNWSVYCVIIVGKLAEMTLITGSIHLLICQHRSNRPSNATRVKRRTPRNSHWIITCSIISMVKSTNVTRVTLNPNEKTNSNDT